MGQFSFKRNPVLWIAVFIAAGLFIANGVKTGDWTEDKLQHFVDTGIVIAGAIIARSQVSPYPTPPTNKEIEEL